MSHVPTALKSDRSVFDKMLPVDDNVVQRKTIRSATAINNPTRILLVLLNSAVFGHPAIACSRENSKPKDIDLNIKFKYCPASKSDSDVMFCLLVIRDLESIAQVKCTR